MTDQSSAPVRLQIMSDLHLETPRARPMYTGYQIDPMCPYLCLLGDIGNAHDSRLFDFLKLQLQKFAIVFYVLGNHEPYSEQRYTFSAAEANMAAFEKSIMRERDAEITSSSTASYGRFIFLNRTRFDLSDTITILGCTFFSRIAESQKDTVSLYVSDFSNIAEWTVDGHNAAHRDDLEWLNREVASISRNEPHRCIVIFTHHSPTELIEANDPEHLRDPRGIRSAFVTDISTEPCWMNPKVRLWAFGHTHFNCDLLDPITGKHLVANQRGYGRDEIFNFYSDKTVSIP